MTAVPPWPLVSLEIVILRVCDFFDVVKNRGCKQNSYDDKLVINSKKSQTLSGETAPLREAVSESMDSYGLQRSAVCSFSLDDESRWVIIELADLRSAWNGRRPVPTRGVKASAFHLQTALYLACRPGAVSDLALPPVAPGSLPDLFLPMQSS